MTSTAKPSDQLLDLLIPLMEVDGYTYQKSHHRFLKPFPLGQYEFSLMFDGRGGLVAVEPAFFVHFTTLEKTFRKVLGYDCHWSAGGTLLNAGGNPWKYWLFEERFASMTPKERAGYASDFIHPPTRIQAAVEFLKQAIHLFAEPLFAKLQTDRDLATFYEEYLRNGFVGRCRPIAENVIHLSLLLAASLGEDLTDILEAAKVLTSGIGGPAIESRLNSVRRFIETAQ